MDEKDNRLVTSNAPIPHMEIQKGQSVDIYGRAQCISCKSKDGLYCTDEKLGRHLIYELSLWWRCERHTRKRERA